MPEIGGRQERVFSSELFKPYTDANMGGPETLPGLIIGGHSLTTSSLSSFFDLSMVDPKVLSAAHTKYGTPN